jgi:hypothetical protein
LKKIRENKKDLIENIEKEGKINEENDDKMKKIV